MLCLPICAAGFVPTLPNTPPARSVAASGRSWAKDVSDVLDYVLASFVVIRYVRLEDDLPHLLAVSEPSHFAA